MNVAAKSSKDSFLLARIRYGDPILPSILLLTDADEDLDTILGTCISDSKMSVTLPTYTGALGEQDAKLEVQKNLNNITGLITQPRALSQIHITIYELTTSGTTNKLLILYAGRAIDATLNPNNKADMVAISISGSKNLLEQKRLGINCSPQCDWTFGDAKTCTKSLVPLTETGRITAVSGTQITITNLSPHVINNRYWQDGYIKKDGITITIRNWDANTTFLLAELIPLVWEETLLVSPFYIEVSVVPGCLRTPDACKFWANEVNFMGAGLKMPAHHPQFEDTE